MNKRMRLQIFYGGGSVIDREITYHGETLEEIAEAVDRDNNELLEYMLTRDDKGAKEQRHSALAVSCSARR